MGFMLSSVSWIISLIKRIGRINSYFLATARAEVELFFINLRIVAFV